MLYNFILQRLTNLGVPSNFTLNLIIGNNTALYLDLRNILAILITGTALIISLLILAVCILIPFKFIHKSMHKWGDKL